MILDQFCNTVEKNILIGADFVRGTNSPIPYFKEDFLMNLTASMTQETFVTTNRISSGYKFKDQFIDLDGSRVYLLVKWHSPDLGSKPNSNSALVWTAQIMYEITFLPRNVKKRRFLRAENDNICWVYNNKQCWTHIPVILGTPPGVPKIILLIDRLIIAKQKGVSLWLLILMSYLIRPLAITKMAIS